MPLYEYECKSCGNKEEHLEHVDASWIRDCAKCGAESGRIFSPFSFDIPGFKNGQYITADDAGKKL